jgi:hypothetical protein
LRFQRKTTLPGWQRKNLPGKKQKQSNMDKGTEGERQMGSGNDKHFRCVEARSVSGIVLSESRL